MNASACHAGDTAEVWTWTAPTTLPVTEVVAFAFAVELGSAWYTESVSVNVTAGLVEGTPVLVVYLDLGSPALPAAGVTAITVALS